MCRCVHEWCEYVCAHINPCMCLTVNVYYLGAYVYLLYMFVNSEGS